METLLSPLFTQENRKHECFTLFERPLTDAPLVAVQPGPPHVCNEALATLLTVFEKKKRMISLSLAHICLIQSAMDISLFIKKYAVFKHSDDMFFVFHDKAHMRT